MITDTDILFLFCIFLALACAGLTWYAWQEHMQAIAQRIRAEEQAMWADHFQASLDTCTAENARLRRLLTLRANNPPYTPPQPVNNQQSAITHQQSILSLPSHHVTPAQFSRN